jgi:hypothetical protein
MVGHREMPDHEAMAEPIQGAGFPVHDAVLEDDLAGQGVIQAEKGLNGIPDLFLKELRNGPNPGADLLEIPLQALLVV